MEEIKTEQATTEQIAKKPARPEVVIRIKHASVRFNIAGERVDNLKEYFIKLVKRELRFKEFYALKDINLVIQKGESWALIGSNGAGKSTLLKLICGILTPYEGTVSVKGEIAPLIELGAGFDPNLTAKENIYINGAILGHSRKFMKEQYEKIVEFAELEDFMELPIKNYSSGMRARLGFAVATVVDPDILIVDEALAVGDAAFQAKCRKRIRELLDHGTTLLYVSHAKAPVMELCEHAVWLDHGEMKKIGSTKHVYWAYEQFLRQKRLEKQAEEAAKRQEAAAQSEPTSTEQEQQTKQE
ncbi:MAG: ABC transporter ATP-binding protein [Clostridia bacterium]|nr:ABC transporter ATP-binding protein [Clostridia bacterium]